MLQALEAACEDRLEKPPSRVTHIIVCCVTGSHSLGRQAQATESHSSATSFPNPMSGRTTPDWSSSNDPTRSSNPHDSRTGSTPENTARLAEGGERGTAARPKRIACIICRKRKLRCDGTKPSCGTCSKLGHKCAYDEVRRKSGPKRGYVKQLEARLGVFFAYLLPSGGCSQIYRSPSRNPAQVEEQCNAADHAAHANSQLPTQRCGLARPPRRSRYGSYVHIRGQRQHCASTDDAELDRDR